MRIKDSDKKKQILDGIESYYRRKRVSPSIQALADECGFSKSLVYRYLIEMREEGSVSYDGREISTVRTRKYHYDAQTVMVPIVGEIACGLPVFAEENAEDYVELPLHLLGDGSFFLLHTKGDSMIDVGVSAGDYVLVRQQTVAEPGQIVVALVGEEATLKRYFPEPRKHRVRLHPENSAMEDIYVDDCRVQGVAIKVIKNLK